MHASVFDRVGLVGRSPIAPDPVAFRFYDDGIPDQSLSLVGPPVPLSTLHQASRDAQCMTRGQRRSLLLRR